MLSHPFGTDNGNRLQVIHMITCNFYITELNESRWFISIFNCIIKNVNCIIVMIMMQLPLTMNIMSAII